MDLKVHYKEYTKFTVNFKSFQHSTDFGHSINSNIHELFSSQITSKFPVHVYKSVHHQRLVERSTSYCSLIGLPLSANIHNNNQKIAFNEAYTEWATKNRPLHSV